MTLQVQEITNFKSGIDLSLDPILAPSDAFVNLNNGFVFKGVLQSRPGFEGFATGVDETNRIVSRVSDEVTDEQPTDDDTGNPAVGNGNTDYTLNLANTEIERVDVTITTTTPAKSVTLVYDPEARTVAPSDSSDDGVGTNTVNYEDGVVQVSFDAAITADPILVTYSYHPNLAIMGIHEYVQTPSPRDLIVLDQQNPYFYDATNNDFDRIDFASGVSFFSQTDNFFTFQNWRLHSKGAVPAVPDPLSLSDLLFFTNNVDEPLVYDGSNVDVISSLDEYREPVEGALEKALHVIAFGERLCWLRPTLGGKEFGQAVLWGPINDNSGLALDYQASGSGILSAATDSSITGIKFLRNNLIVYFETDVYVLEINKDAFQPFRWTLIEEDRGVEPTHAAVSFFGKVQSPGRLGIIGTDGRRAGRVDEKIPFFTRDEIDPNLFSHVFGEEMEEDSQFWWTYPDFTSDLTTSNNVLAKNFEEDNFATYDLKISVLNKTIKGFNTVWNNLQEVFGGPDPDDGDVGDFEGPVADVIWNKWGLKSEIYKTIFGDHNGFIFQVGESFNDGQSLISPKTGNGSPITTGATTTVELEYHHFKKDDVVTFRNVEGMTEINGKRATITSVPDRSSIVVNIDSTEFSAYTGGGTVVKAIKFEAEFVPFNPFRSKGQRTYIGKMDFLIKTATGKYIVEFFDERSNQPWTIKPPPNDDEPTGTAFSFSADDSDRTDQWVSIYVDQTADFQRWKISQDVIDGKISIKSIRLFFREAGVSNV